MRTTTAALGVGAALAGSAAAAFYGYEQMSKRWPRYRQQRELLREYEKKMLPDRSDMQPLEDDIVKQMEDGMRQTGASSVLMLPTYVLRLPQGDEAGSCYALDIGGTNFRVMYCELSGDHSRVDKSVIEQVAIPREVYTGDAARLFGFLADSLKGFIARHKPEDLQARPTVGFCFSFPMEQAALDSARLVAWTKGFDVDGVMGKDVVKLLSDALERAGAPCRVAAIINDSVGVLAAARYEDQATEVGIILGTGTNACIVDKVSKLSKWKPDFSKAGAGVGGGSGGKGGGGGGGGNGAGPDTLTAINTEWGCYSSPLLPRTQEDEDLDAASGPYKGQMLIEKLMSGLWMGDCARRHLLAFARRAKLFGDNVPARLVDPSAFTTAHLSELESDRSPLRRRAAKVLREALGVDASELGLEAVLMAQEVCRLVVRRSARMMATALVAILRLQGWMDAPRRIVVAVDGGVVLKYGNWRGFLDEYLREAFAFHGHDARRLARLVEFRPQADGSSLGAAVLAAAAVAGSQ